MNDFAAQSEGNMGDGGTLRSDGGTSGSKGVAQGGASVADTHTSREPLTYTLPRTQDAQVDQTTIEWVTFLDTRVPVRPEYADRLQQIADLLVHFEYQLPWGPGKEGPPMPEIDVLLMNPDVMTEWLVQHNLAGPDGHARVFMNPLSRVYGIDGQIDPMKLGAWMGSMMMAPAHLPSIISICDTSILVSDSKNVPLEVKVF